MEARLLSAAAAGASTSASCKIDAPLLLRFGDQPLIDSGPAFCAKTRYTESRCRVRSSCGRPARLLPSSAQRPILAFARDRFIAGLAGALEGVHAALLA